MPNRDNKNRMQMVFLGTLTLSGTTPTASDWVDLQGFDACTLVAKANTITDAGDASGFSFEVQEGDDTTDAGATAVADAELVGLESDLTVTDDAADDEIIGAIGYVGNARYARLEATGSTGTDAGVDVYAIVGEASQEPPTFVGTSVAAT